MSASNFQKSLGLVLQSEGGDHFRSELSYCPETGNFTWLRDSNNKQRLAGDVAGGLHKSTGYWRIKFKGQYYLAHRLAFFFMTGRWPEPTCDHENGIRHENWWGNLREANASQQRANCKLNSDSTSGVRGVYFNKRRRKWRAHIQREHLGYFETKEAAAAVVAAEFDRRFGPEFRRAA